MSTANDNRTHTKTVNNIKEKATIILTEDVINKIDILHNEVEKNTEWSAILIYKTLEGSINDPENWKMEVVDVIPMDIGSAAYTEYDYDANDEYSFEKIVDYMSEGFRLGHLHSHHNMNCYFSPTDMSELHDNSPNHNYYLSLIVNYKNYTEWCAKVAYCHKQVVSGVLKRQINYFGQSSLENNEEDVEINDIKEIMNVIDINIEKDINVEEDFLDRIESLVEKKKVRVLNQAAATSTTTSTYKGNGNNVNLGNVNYLDATKKGKFNETAVMAFVKNWLQERTVSVDLTSTPLREIVARAHFTTKQSETTKNKFLAGLMRNFEALAREYFTVTYLSRIDKHCITLMIYEILEKFEDEFRIVLSINYELYDFLIDAVKDTTCEYYTEKLLTADDYLGISESTPAVDLQQEWDDEMMRGWD